MKQSYLKEEWNQMIKDYRSNDMGLTKWCEEHEVSKYAIKYHIYHKHHKKD